MSETKTLVEGEASVTCIRCGAEFEQEVTIEIDTDDLSLTPKDKSSLWHIQFADGQTKEHLTLEQMRSYSHDPNVIKIRFQHEPFEHKQPLTDRTAGISEPWGE